MTERRSITEEIRPFDEISVDDEYTLPLARCIEQLKQALDSIPAEYRQTAMFRIWAGGDYVTIHPEVNYKRPETDEELNDRIASHERYMRDRDEQERRRYEELKQKYG